MYNVAAYGQMLADRTRRDAYAAALARAVRPGAVVIEIGSGPGVFALHAARLGAGHVYALEPDDVVELGSRLAAQHDLADRVTFLQTHSREFMPPARADVIVSDLRGVLPLFRDHIASIVDARTRLLAPSGVLIPARDRLFAAVVEAPDAIDARLGIWQQPVLDLDLELVRGLEVNRPSKAVLPAEACLTGATVLVELDYRTVVDDDLDARLVWRASRTGTAHGVAAWFDTELHDGVGFSNAPGTEGSIYSQLLFPFERPTDVAAGDEVVVHLEARRTDDDYLWRWRTEVRAAGRSEIRFDQSSFLAAPLSPASLAKRAARYRPSLSDQSEALRFTLERMNGTRTLEEIAEELFAAFPVRFDDRRSAFDQVCAWSARHG